MHHKNIMVQESIPLPCWIYMFLFPHFTLSYLCLADGLCFVYLQQEGEVPSNHGAWFFHTFSVKVVKILSLMSFFALYRFLVSAVRLSGLGYSHAIISLFYCTFLMKYPYHVFVLRKVGYFSCAEIFGIYFSLHTYLCNFFPFFLLLLSWYAYPLSKASLFFDLLGSNLPTLISQSLKLSTLFVKS